MKEPYKELADRELRAAGEDEDFPLTEIALGLAFLFGAVVFGLLNPPGTLVVSFALMIPTAALLGSALQTVARRRRAISDSGSGERELLAAIRNSGDDITPAEAAMETSLTVREADRMLTELANEGYLKVESRDGVISYGLPARERRELD